MLLLFLLFLLLRRAIFSRTTVNLNWWLRFHFISLFLYFLLQFYSHFQAIWLHNISRTIQSFRILCPKFIAVIYALVRSFLMLSHFKAKWINQRACLFIPFGAHSIHIYRNRVVRISFFFLSIFNLTAY